MQALDNERDVPSTQPLSTRPSLWRRGAFAALLLIGMSAMALGLPHLSTSPGQTWSPLIGDAVAKSKGPLSPFAPLTPLYHQLRKAASQFLQGPPKSISPFLLHKRVHKPNRYQQRTYKSLAQIAGPQIGWIAFELETLLRSGKQPRLHVRWVLALTKNGWRVAEVRSYPRNTNKGVAASQLGGASMPLVSTAKQLLVWLKGGHCNHISVLSPKDVPSFMPKSFFRRMFRGVKRTQKRLKALCKQSQQMKFDNVMFYVDDIYSFILNKKGELKGGLKFEWRLQSKGELILGPPRFRVFR